MRGVLHGTWRGTVRSAVIWWLQIGLCLAALGVCPQAWGETREESDTPPADTAEPDFLKPRATASLSNIPEEPLAEVLIEGNVTIAQDDISRKIRTRPGRVATSNLLREDIKTLYATKWFFSVEVRFRESEKGPVLVFRVHERPILKKVSYEGAKKIKVKELEGLTGLKTGSAFDVGTNREAARRIENHYRDKGYLFAKVELGKGNHRDDREVVFQINEGPKVQVSSIKFAGNNSFPGGLLKPKLKTKTRMFWFLGGTYDPATIPEDVAVLKEYYHGLGYFDVKIKHEEKFSKDKATLSIAYTIDEGPRYKVRNIQFAGNKVIPVEKLREEMKLHESDFFNERFLKADIEKITGQYGERGRIFAKIDAQPRFLEEPGTMDLVVKIDEDRPYVIRRINVRINGEHPHTKVSTVLNPLTIHPGDMASALAIKQSENRLKGTQFFVRDPQNAPQMSVVRVEKEDEALTRGLVRYQSPEVPPAPRRPAVSPRRAPLPPPSVQEESAPSFPEFDLPLPPALAGPPLNLPAESIVRFQSPDGPAVPGGLGAADDYTSNGPYQEALTSPAEAEPPPGMVDVNVDVTEAQTGSLMFGVGVNSDAGLLGSVMLQENNFDISRFPTSFQDFADGIAFRGGGQQFRLEAVPGSQVSRYLVSWRDPYFLDQNFSVGGSGYFFNRIYSDWTERRAGGRVSVGHQFTPAWSLTGTFRAEEVRISNIPAVSPQILRDVLGSNLLGTARIALAHDTRDIAFLPGRGHFIEAAFEQGVIDFIYPRAELEARQYFTLWERPDGTNRHIVWVGGNLGWTGDDTPIFERYFGGGFQSFRGFAFRGVSPIDTGVRVGGLFELLGTVEYQIPILANDMLQTVVFSDFGTVDDKVQLDNFRVSVGAGLRITIPAMGPAPIALDFAVPISDQSYDQRRLFSFYVGMSR